MIALAIAAHPDDIEFYMAGTLLHLREQGVQTHYMNLSSGNCGSQTMDGAETTRVRANEAMNAADLLGAVYHPSLLDDLEIAYDVSTLRRLTAIVRAVGPDIVLTHSPDDYMEDHMITARLAVTATFGRGAPNFQTVPPIKAIDKETVVYHAMPHGLRTAMRQRIIPEIFVNTDSVHAQKRAALACHDSQKAWLDATQGMDSYIQTMHEMASEVGRLSGRCETAEGWRRRIHYGFSATLTDPFFDILGDLCHTNPDYEKGLG
ncbi:MAG: LmbE family N-acetylglucosaminyl deacetylase [Rhodothermales bacterium]|jgi:LmbE family N-acetylglucosaminyl deacetylase